MSDYREMRLAMIAKIGPDRLIKLIEENSDIRFTKKCGDWQMCYGDAEEKNPSAGVNLLSWVLHDFRGEDRCLEDVIGRGDKSLGAKILYKESGLKPGELGFSNGKIPKAVFDPEVIEREVESHLSIDSLRRAAPLIQAFADGCCDDLKGIDYIHPMVEWLEKVRGISRDVAIHRGIGLASEARLKTLADVLLPLSPNTSKAISSFDVHVGSRLVWPMRTKEFITRLKFRGIPYGDRKNIVTLAFTNKVTGWMGDPQPGELFCFEGEFNLLMCDHHNGSPINGIALGGSSGAQKDAELIRSLSPDLTIIADNDDPGIKMAQTIANVKASSVIYPVGVKDADDFIKSGKTFKDLLALKQMIVPTWTGLSENIKKLASKAPSEPGKATTTKAIMDALAKKGRFIHTTTDDLLYLEN